jgi:hypothetical protein
MRKPRSPTRSGARGITASIDAASLSILGTVVADDRSRRSRSGVICAGVNVLDVFPEVYEQWRAVLHDGWRVTDPELLEQCLPRIADAHGRPSGRVAPLDELDERTRAAVEYVDQYVIDQNGVTEAQREGLARHLAPWAFDDFAFVIWMHDADVRARVLLRIDEGPDERELTPVPALADGQLTEYPVTDQAFGARLASFANAVHARKVLDPETAELARLRNAVHQRCLM